MNKVIISGRFTKEHELRYNQSGTAILANTIASNRKFKNQNGEYDTDFVNVVMFNNQAKFISDYSNKGDEVLIEGRLQNRSYETQDGQKRYVTEVIVDSVELMRTKKKEEPTTEPDPYQFMATKIDDEECDLIEHDGLPY